VSQPSIAEDLAALLTDLNRMTYDNEDPMRFSKRTAKSAAYRILTDAIQAARQVAELPGLIDTDFKESK